VVRAIKNDLVSWNCNDESVVIKPYAMPVVGANTYASTMNAAKAAGRIILQIPQSIVVVAMVCRRTQGWERRQGKELLNQQLPSFSGSTSSAGTEKILTKDSRKRKGKGCVLRHGSGGS
jgi:hypothetical protein